MSNTKTLNIYTINIAGNTQARVAINQDTVADYAAAMLDDADMPAPIVFFDGVENWLADGFHRFHAHLKNGKTAIIVEQRKGTQRDAILFSLSANTVHGLRPTSDDKRKAVAIMLADPEWSELSDRAIARHCGCSHPLVADMRNPKPAQSGNSSTPKQAVSGNSSSQDRVASGNSSSAQTGPSGNSSTKPAKTQAQVEAEQNAQDAHGDDADPVALLEQALAENQTLQQELFAVQADDQKAETIKWHRIAEVQRRRQEELMDTVNAREKELQRQANWLKRISVALGEDDYSKLAAKVESLARAQKDSK